MRRRMRRSRARRCSAASPRGRGRDSGSCGWAARPTRQVSQPAAGSTPRAAGSLHAGVAVPAGDRDRLEHLCRYVLRPPIAQDALELDAAGGILLRLRRPWRDGTWAVRFAPTELLEKLAAMIPKPRINLLVYHGAFAPHARRRPEAVRRARDSALRPEGGWQNVGRSTGYSAASAGRTSPSESAEPGAQQVPQALAPPGRSPPPVGADPAVYARPKYYPWADLLRRTFAIDVLECPVAGAAYGWWRRSPTRRRLRPSCATSASRWTSPCRPRLGARSRGRRRSRPATIRSRRRRAAYPPRSVWGPFSRARRGRSDCRLPKSGGQRPRSVRAALLRGHGAAATPLTTRLSAPWLEGRLVAQRGEREADPTSDILGLRQIGG